MNKILTFNNFLRLNESADIDDQIKHKVTDGQYIICFALTSNMPEDFIDKKDEWTGEKKQAWSKELGLAEVDMGQWYMHAGMNKETMRRMFEKYKLLLQGNREGTSKEVLFPRIINMYDKLMSMDKSEVIKLADKALDETPLVKDAQGKAVDSAKSDAAAKTALANDFMKSVVQGPFKGQRDKAAKYFGGKVNKTPKQFLDWIGK